MTFLEEITATAGQIVKDLEHHLEKYPQTADEVITSYSDGKSLPITDISSVDDASQDCHGNHCEYVCFEYDWEKEDQGITTSKMLEIFKSLDPLESEPLVQKPENRLDNS